jgi:tripartite ATP-independent transporter DctM subunit
MDWPSALLLLLGTIFVLLAMGLPVAFAFITANFIGAYVFLGGTAGLIATARSSVSAIALFSLAPIPLFILLGTILFHTGLATQAITAIDRLISRVPGRLSLVAITAGTIFSALSGSTVANTAVLGSMLIPEMTRRGYHPSMSIGPILGTGAIAIMIPPSALTVLLGSLAQISIAHLLIGGILPGVLIAGIYFAYVVLRCWLNPSLAPSYDVARYTFRERFGPFLVHVVPLLVIFVVVVGSILGGVATPTESAALGSVASVLVAIGYGRLTWTGMRAALLETAKISVMVLFIIAGSITFSQILAFSGATSGMLALIQSWNLGPLGLVAVMLLVLLALGCFVDQLSMIMITLPFFMPLVKAAGIDPVWFGVLMLLMLEISFTTPPFGMLLFVMKGVAPPGTTMRQIYSAAAPFIALVILVVLLTVLMPGIATWLPDVMTSRR